MAENQTSKELFQFAGGGLQDEVYHKQQEKLGHESESFAKTVAKRFF